MNNKGFTLVEILAMLVILAIIVSISVPNISGILSKQKENISIEDANKLVDTAKIKTRTGKGVILPNGANNCNIYTMSFLDLNDDYTTGTNGGPYDKYESFVLIKKTVTNTSGIPEAKYENYVRLFEKVDGQYMGIELTKIEDLEKNIKPHMKTFDRKVGIGATATLSTVENGITTINSSLCSHIERVYVNSEITIKDV